MLNPLIINLLLSLLWPTLNGNYTAQSLFIGFFLGFIVMAVVEPSYGKFCIGLVLFTVYVMYQILVSNIRLALLVLRVLFKPGTPIRPSIVAIPLEITHDVDKTILASIITLTPGTLSIDLGTNEAGQEVLYVHTIDLPDAESFRRDIKTKFEQRILSGRRALERAA